MCSRLCCSFLQNAGNSAIHFCVTYGYAEIMALVKEAGGDATAANKEGRVASDGIE